MNALPSGTVTFLFADVEGSTELLRAAPADYAGIIADVRRLLSETRSTRRAAREVDATGDELFAVFADAPSAAEAAVEAQRGFRDHAWPPGSRVRVRIGLHTGTAELNEEGYTGIDVVRASRIASSGHGGQIVSPTAPPRSSRAGRSATSAPTGSPGFPTRSGSAS